MSETKWNQTLEVACNRDYCTQCPTLMACLYTIVGVFCMIGNGMVLYAIYKTPYLQTVSNYFIASLAVADFSVGVLVNPFWAARSALSVWHNQHPLTVITAYMSMQTAVTTTFNLCAVSIDRYVAITRPLHYERILTRRRCKIIIAIIWILSFVLPIPRPLVTDPSKVSKIWMTGSTLVILLPLIIITYCYYHIVREVKRHISSIASINKWVSSLNDGVVTRKRNTKAAWTVAIVIGVFLVLWFPSLILTLLLALNKKVCDEEKLTRVWSFTVLVAFFSSAVNPLVYTARNQEYRNAFRSIFFNRGTKHDSTVAVISNSMTINERTF
ncbi:5-hydroxytryptamine receptor 2A-like [Actinia tenebrosa]|uniref:5-hydroxytryptamine receptor 2A-like n=1 Tax=Actinia tenebrosa TaxID=6105 RepID=A0A6P8HNK0_ACTTE|nr:5-hydroxytryptamine receptor 2A-like [Actinia tenebrosa]